MTNQESSTLIEARELFAEFERTPDWIRRLRCFRDAIELLEQYVDEHENKRDELECANNIRKTYASKFVEQFPSWDVLELDEFAMYCLAACDEDIKKLCTEYPLLKTRLDDFFKSPMLEEVLRILRSIHES